MCLVNKCGWMTGYPFGKNKIKSIPHIKHKSKFQVDQKSKDKGYAIKLLEECSYVPRGRGSLLKQTDKRNHKGKDKQI